MQLRRFTDGGFVIHAVKIEPSPCRFSAWYDKSGALIDAQAYDRTDRERNPSPAQIERLKLIGQIWKEPRQ